MKINSFDVDTYIVLDLPKQVSEKIKNVRECYNYPDALPVEITLAGSSGIGVLQGGQDQGKVFEEVDEIAAKTKPVNISFSDVSSFPNTNIFFNITKWSTVKRDSSENKGLWNKI